MGAGVAAVMGCAEVGSALRRDFRAARPFQRGRPTNRSKLRGQWPVRVGSLVLVFMGFARLGLGAVALVLTLAGCSAGDSASDGSRHDFRPVRTAQPTEEGQWVVDPSDPMALYALGNRSLRSRDGGHTWSDLNWPKGARALHFASMPARALYLEVQTSEGAAPSEIFKSRDDGKHWSLVGHGDRVSVIDQGAGPVLLTLENHLSRSTDDGATWSEVQTPPGIDPLSLGNGPEMLVSADVNPVVYIGARAVDLDSFEIISAVLVSTDAGATFVVNPVPSSARAFTAPDLSLDCRGRLYVLADHTVFRSSDAGVTWQRVLDLDPSVFSFHIAPSPATECGDALHATGELQTGAPQLFAIDAAGNLSVQTLPDGGHTLDLGDERLLLLPFFGPPRRSDDAGRSWWTAGVALSTELSLSAAQRGLLFSANVAAVYRSENGGIDWLPGALQAKGNPSDLYPDPHDANVVYARSIYGDDSPWSFISTDRGASFQDWPVPSRENAEIPEAVVSSASGVVTVVTRKGVYTTDDAGAHFSRRLVLSAEEQVSKAAISSSEPLTIYVCLFGADPQAHEIRISSDGGATWASRDLGTYVDDLIVHPGDGSIAFATSGLPEFAGILRTNDAGQTWERLALPSAEARVTLKIDPLPPHALYAVGEHLSRSDDQGSTWRVLADMPARFGDFELSPHSSGTRYFLDQGGLLYDFVE